jgi:hypothetical protein
MAAKIVVLFVPKAEDALCQNLKKDDSTRYSAEHLFGSVFELFLSLREEHVSTNEVDLSLALTNNKRREALEGKIVICHYESFALLRSVVEAVRELGVGQQAVSFHRIKQERGDSARSGRIYASDVDRELKEDN